MKEKWKRIASNYVLKRDGWYISYNPSRECQSETAIVIKDNNFFDFYKRFFILYGDFREELENKNLKEALHFFLSKQDSAKSNWCDPIEECKKILEKINKEKKQ